MDLTTLSEDALLAICERLFIDEGYVVHASEKQLGRETIDALVSPPTALQETWAVELRRKGDLASLRRAATDLFARQQQFGAVRSLLITPHVLPANLVQRLKSETPCDVWDGKTLDSMLKKHGKIKAQVARLIDAQDELLPVEASIPTSGSAQNPGKNLANRLQHLPPGTKHWKDYETLCIEIFNYVFSPSLRPHREEYRRSEDGLDIRDAIFPMTPGNPFWDRIHLHHRARMVVLECKNLSEELGQTEVESISQYLYPKAMRSFGILCGRKGAKLSALTARRRTWQAFDGLIVMLSDVDLQELLRLKRSGEEPTDLLDQHLDEFFIKLAP